MYDHTTIIVSSGQGGNGTVSFRHEKYVPFGGPDGGDGGNGGALVFRADASLTGLSAYRRSSKHRAENGGDGGGQKRHGANGQDMVLKVPEGTVITDASSGLILADLAGAGDAVKLLAGGQGGRGNVRFASPTYQAPRLRQRGETGQELELNLEMRLIADVGIIGYPNAGKSTLLRAASAARPKVASYPFTTLAPVLGTAEVGASRLVLAEIPGLITGAHLGRGLGHDFLRHVMRTRVLIHLIDGGSEEPENDLARLNVELSLYDADLGRKPQLVAVNKIDLPEVSARRDGIADDLTAVGIAVHFVSAATGEGVPELLRAALDLLEAAVPAEPPAAPEKVFRPRPRDEAFHVRREDTTLIVTWPDLERVEAGSGAVRGELEGYLRRRLQRAGGQRAFRAAGACPGDRVRLGETEWEWA